MSAAVAGGRPLHYFIHDDFDAFRIEISGGLIGRAAEKVYDSWRSARSMALRTQMVVDISFVTAADEVGEAVLQAWHEQDAQIVASTPVSRAIVDSILHQRVAQPALRRGLLARLVSAFRPRAAEISSNAEPATIRPARPRQMSAENTGVFDSEDMERQLR